MRTTRLLPLLLLAAVGTLLTIVACRRSDNFLDTSSATVTTTLKGRIVDEQKQPVSGALVKAGGQTATTDVNGEFTIANVSVSKRNAFVQVEKTGYFPGSRTLAVQPGTREFMSIELIPRRITGQFGATTGGSVPLDAGGSIQFPAAGIVTASGAAYSGTVQVAAFTFDPTAPNFADIMPGTLRAINSANQERALQSFSMVAVELIGAGGEKLQLAPGKTATISFPIPAALQASAPASIPLWYFDESTGLWKEEGAAARQGDKYVGTVAHFSFWNCDRPWEFVNFETKVVYDQSNARGVPLDSVWVELISVSSGIRQAMTNSNGYVSGAVPNNEQLVMMIYDKCRNLVYTSTIGPFAADASTITTVTSMNIPTAVTFTGTAAACNGQPVTNGYVALIIDNNIRRAQVINGTYSFTHVTCGNTVSAQLKAMNLGANVEGIPVTVTANAGSTVQTALSACGQTSSQFIQYVFRNTTVRFQPPADSLIGWAYPASGETFFYAFPDPSSTNPQPNELGIGLRAATLGTGSHEITSLDVYHNNQMYLKSGTASAQITSYGPIMGFIEGTFSGTVRDSLSQGTYPISGSFRVRRGN